MFLHLWPIVVYVAVTSFAERYAFAFSGYHDFHPQRFLPLTSLIQVCQFAYMMHLYMLFAFTYFTRIVKYSLDYF